MGEPASVSPARPERALQSVAVADRVASVRATRNRFGQADGRIRVAHEILEGARAHRLPQRLRAQVGGADRVRRLDHRRSPRVVAPDRQRQAEGEDESDETEQRRLEDTERLAQGVCVSAQPATCCNTQQRRAEHDSEDQQPELEAAQPEEHSSFIPTKVVTCRSIMRDAPDDESCRERVVRSSRLTGGPPFKGVSGPLPRCCCQR